MDKSGRWVGQRGGYVRWVGGRAVVSVGSAWSAYLDKCVKKNTVPKIKWQSPNIHRRPENFLGVFFSRDTHKVLKLAHFGIFIDI